MRFRISENSLMLAFLRTYGEETLLSVNNLSAEPCEFELELADFAGSRPVDLFSGEKLPAIGRQTYSLQLDRYGYRWLKLQ